MSGGLRRRIRGRGGQRPSSWLGWNPGYVNIHRPSIPDANCTSPSRQVCLVALEILYGPFMLLCGLLAGEGSKVLAFAGLRVLLLRVQTVLTRLQFSDHERPPSCEFDGAFDVEDRARVGEILGAEMPDSWFVAKAWCTRITVGCGIAHSEVSTRGLHSSVRSTCVCGTWCWVACLDLHVHESLIFGTSQRRSRWRLDWDTIESGEIAA